MTHHNSEQKPMTALPQGFHSKLPDTGTTIFTLMSNMAKRYGADNLSQGAPDFEPDARLLQRLHHHNQTGSHQYAAMPGEVSLLDATAELIEQHYQRKVDPDSMITVTAGATEALFAAIHCSVHPGDEVILFDPAYDSYAPAVRLAGGCCRHIPLKPPAFAIDWQQVSDHINENTRLIIVNSPHNPSGALLDHSDWQALEALVIKHDLLVISDEVYEFIHYEAKRRSAHHYPALAERSFIISSFGKTLHTTGWKIGYCVAPPALTTEFRKLHQFLTFTVIGAPQKAIADFLRQDPGHLDALPAFYQAKRDRFRALLHDSGFDCLPCRGSYFQLCDYSRVSDLPDLDFCKMLTQQCGVAAIPLSPFYAEAPPDQRLVRFCFAKQDATLERAARKLSAIKRVTAL